MGILTLWVSCLKECGFPNFWWVLFIQSAFPEATFCGRGVGQRLDHVSAKLHMISLKWIAVFVCGCRSRPFVRFREICRAKISLRSIIAHCKKLFLQWGEIKILGNLDEHFIESTAKNNVDNVNVCSVISVIHCRPFWRWLHILSLLSVRNIQNLSSGAAAMLSWRRRQRHRSMNSVLLGNLKLSLQSAATLPAHQPAPLVQLALSPSDTREMKMKSLSLCLPSQLLELLWLDLRLKCLVSRSVGVWGCHSLERPQVRCTIGCCYSWICTSRLVSSMKPTFVIAQKSGWLSRKQTM